MHKIERGRAQPTELLLLKTMNIDNITIFAYKLWYILLSSRKNKVSDREEIG